MRQIAEFVAVLSCSLFTGAAVYVSLVEHPARMQCGVEVAATEFQPSYRRGTVMQVTSAALGHEWRALAHRLATDESGCVITSSNAMRRILAILGSAIFLVIAPGIVAGYIPWRICHLGEELR